MSTLADFYDHLLPELPGCSTDLLDLHLREVAREFCQKTTLWRQTLTAVDTVAGQAIYSLVLQSSTELIKLHSLTVNGLLLWLDRDPDRNHDSCAERPKYLPQDPPFSLDPALGQIALISNEVPSAAQVGGLVVLASVKPTHNATTLPDFLLNQYSEAIRFGTLSRLMLMNKKPWTNLATGSFYGASWNSHLNHAAYMASVGNTGRQLRVRKSPV